MTRQCSPVLRRCEMAISRRKLMFTGVTLLGSTTLNSATHGFDGPLRDLVEDTEEFKIASDAYVFGYPLVTMEVTRRVVTNVQAPVGSRGPMGQLIKLRSYPDANFRDVTAPNADTLYTTAFMDVG